MLKRMIIAGMAICAMSAAAEARDVYLHGSFNEWTDQEEYKFQPVGDSENHYVLYAVIPAGSSSNPNKFKVSDKEEGGQKYRGSSSTSDTQLNVVDGVIKALNSKDGSGGESSVTLTYGMDLRIRFEYWAKYKFDGDTDESYHSALAGTVCPENMYLFGHLRGNSWSTDDYYMAACDEGVYRFADVNISGNSSDKNYFAFYASQPTASNNGSLYPRWKGYYTERNDGQNVLVASSEFTEENDNTVQRTIQVGMSRPGSGDSNFGLPEGMYDITVDQISGKMTISKLDMSYKWHDGSGKLISGTSYAIGQGQDHDLQLSSRGILMHDAAKKARIEIEYHSFYEPDDEYEETYGIRAVEEEPAYTIYDDNYISLHKVGNYTITASLPDEYKSDYIGIEPATLNVTVNSVITSVSEIKAEDAPAEYYTLQGVKVSRPSNGFYIVVKGNKATKHWFGR